MAILQRDIQEHVVHTNIPKEVEERYDDFEEEISKETIVWSDLRKQDIKMRQLRFLVSMSL